MNQTPQEKVEKELGFRYSQREDNWFQLMIHQPDGSWMPWDDEVPPHSYPVKAFQLCLHLQEEVDRLIKERDLAVVHDTQPYPTAFAYEATCKALEESKLRISDLERERRELAEWFFSKSPKKSLEEIRKMCEEILKDSK